MITQRLLLWAAMLALGVGTAASAHQDHHHREVLADSSYAAWRGHLTEFARVGAAKELRYAKQIAAHHEQRGAIDVEYLYLAARTSQADHRFVQALDFLGQLLVLQPSNTGAVLLTASIHRAQGRTELARNACHRLRRASALVALACHSQALDQPDATALQRLRALTKSQLAKRESQPVQAWVHAAAADLAVQLGDHQGAIEGYQRAQALDPSVRYQSAMVDCLLRLDQPERALTVLGEQPQALALQVKQFVALTRVGRLDADDVRMSNMARLFRREQIADNYTHGREMAEFYLDVRHDAAMALDVLERYIDQQHEYEDTVLRTRALQALQPSNSAPANRYRL